MAKIEILTGWLARDEFKNSRRETPGSLFFYSEAPVRDISITLGGYWDGSMGGYWDGSMGDYIELPETMFPELTWENDPKFVKLTIEVLQ